MCYNSLQCFDLPLLVGWQEGPVSNYAPPIRPRLMALYKCALIDWLKGIRPVKSWVFVCWQWRLEWSFAQLMSSVVTTTSIILRFNKHWLTQVHLENVWLYGDSELHHLLSPFIRLFWSKWPYCFLSLAHSTYVLEMCHIFISALGDSSGQVIVGGIQIRIFIYLFYQCLQQVSENVLRYS